MRILSKPLPKGSGPQGFAERAKPKSKTASLWVDLLMQEPKRGVLQNVTIRQKDGSENIIPRFKHGWKRDFEKEIKPEVTQAIETGRSLEVSMCVEISDGRPYERVFVAKFSQGFPIKVRPNKAPNNPGIPPQYHPEHPEIAPDQ